MADRPDTPAQDWRSTVFLPATGFPMKAGLAAKEPAILARWAAEDLYGTLRRQRAGRPRFILHDGPPYANGDIHMGHAMNKVLKDIIVRSQSLLGKDAPYVPGWDCHGLPIEWKVEEGYRAKKLNKDEVDPVQFRAECRAYAAKWVDVQREQFKRLGVMGDWDDPYLTMKYDAEAAIVGELLKFAETGQLYRGAKPVMWSPVEKTALAEAEVEYEDIVSTQIDVAFEIVESPIEELVGAYAVIWTTTPWTIPVNQAIAYGPEVQYDLIEWRGRRLLVAFGCQADTMRRWGYDPTSNEAKLIASFGGDRLASTVARHPMAKLFSPLPFRGGAGGGASLPGEAPVDSPHPNPVSGRPVPRTGLGLPGAVQPETPQGEGLDPTSPLAEFFLRPRPFLPGEFVTTDAGTGLVHMAPDHGEDDFLLCKAHGIDPVFAVEGDGKYRADWAWLGGQGSVIAPKFNAPDGPICSDLRDAGALLAASADYRHSYPHSWRSKAKLIFRATPQWFIGMDKPVAPSPLRGEGTPATGDASSPGATPLSQPSPRGGEGFKSNAPTLRQLALDAIERTRWVPEKARNRIHAMVDGRPDWVISRQRAWGVPIALYVDLRSGAYLIDESVNARIVAAFAHGGADAWFTADHQALLGPDHDAADYEPVNDILDVWFDSGSTHAFTIEARYGKDVRADLYLEGSDQHRGWFQSSLLESCGTRGRAPYAAVLTHGFALDGQGRKMSKSLGNVVDPLKIIQESGADILRLWVASTDYFEDVRIGKEVLATTSDAYRKLRNTFRYLLGALDGFSDDERVAAADMPELERYMLHLLSVLDDQLRRATEDFEFNSYARALTDFCNNDLSAFFFDIRKDSLYCDASTSLTRRSYRTVLDILFHALVRYAAPILCFTAEEVWGTRFPEAGSVHLLEWPEVDAAWGSDALHQRWQRIRELRTEVSAHIEPLRRGKVIGSSLEASVTIGSDNEDAKLLRSLDFWEICITAPGTIMDPYDDEITRLRGVGPLAGQGIGADVVKTGFEKCGRCWRHLPEVETSGALCARCAEVVGG